MSFLSGLKSLFSNNTAEKIEESIEYNGYSIVPAPITEGGQFRVAGTITKGDGETLQTHQFIRSDLIGSRAECISETIRKSKVAIDQNKEYLFK